MYSLQKGHSNNMKSFKWKECYSLEAPKNCKFFQRQEDVFFYLILYIHCESSGTNVRSFQSTVQPEICHKFCTLLKCQYSKVNNHCLKNYWKCQHFLSVKDANLKNLMKGCKAGWKNFTNFTKRCNTKVASKLRIVLKNCVFLAKEHLSFPKRNLKENDIQSQFS